jgi:hypothetical protein
MTVNLPTSDYYLIGKLYLPDYQGTVTAVGWGLTSSSTLQIISFILNDEPV